jgi:hypothetical protein
MDGEEQLGRLLSFLASGPTKEEVPATDEIFFASQDDSVSCVIDNRVTTVSISLSSLNL